MRRHWLHLTVLGVAALLGSVSSRAGQVTLQDGRSLQGDVRFEGDQLVVGPPSAAIAVRLKDLKRAILDRPTSRPSQASWASADVGEPAQSGATVEQGLRIRLSDYGRGIGDHRKRRPDQFRFYYQPLHGDGQLITRVLTVDGTEHSRAGIMIRESLEARCAFAFIARNGNAACASELSARPKSGELAERLAGSQRIVLGGTWLKLVRKGELFSAYESTDGKKWDAIGEVTVPVSVDAPPLIGLALGGGNGNASEAVFDDTVLSAASAPTGTTTIDRGVIYRGGTQLAGEVTHADARHITFVRQGQEAALQRADVASLVFRPLIGELTNRVAQAEQGAILLGGDCMVGEFGGLENGVLRVTSVLFGPKSYDVKREVAAMAFGTPKPVAARYEIRLADGSLLRAREISFADGQCVIEDACAGRITASTSDVVEVRRTGK